MGKSTHFIGQPLLRQIINFLNKDKVLRLSLKHGGERYVKHFDGWQHLVVMLYAVIMRFDSLREIVIATLAEARKLAHLGVTTMPRRSTLSDANARRPESFFEAVYRDLYATHRKKLLSDSRSGGRFKWMEKLQIIDSTTITLFSNIIFKGAGRNPKTGKKKGMTMRVQNVIFTKKEKNGETIIHHARIVTHADERKMKCVSLLTIMQRSLNKRWSFSNLATTVRITLMYYVNFYSFFENPEKDWKKVLLEVAESPPQLQLKL